MANPSSNKCLFLSLLSMFLFLQVIKASQEEYPKSQESDRVINLPGQPTSPSISQFSGYINVNQHHGRALFYWFFQAQSQWSNKPLLLWLNGGPGCSSVGYGAAAELGPLRVNKNGVGLHFNKYAWNKEANLLFVESPVGVGFSYTNTSSDFTKLDDGFVAEDAYNFLVNWLQRFPQFKTHDFFIAGESYAGHYVPQLAELVYDRNKDTSKYPKINLKGFIVGNPETDDYYDYKGLLEYAWSHTVITDQHYDKAKQVCDFKSPNWSIECNIVMNQLFEKYNEIDIYNIYAPKCIANGTSSLAHSSDTVNSLAKVNNYRMRRMRLFGGYDPCFSDYIEEYFNRKDVQSSLHASIKGRTSNVKWKVCNGDADGRVPVLGSRYCIEALGLSLKSPWRSWYHNHQVGGRMVEYEGLTFVTVRGAGHLVPLNKPSEALSLIHSFLTGEPLPAHR
ncbi:serine carboxypeptidase-like 33 isoform X2 [Castanea sativa]|uniref:serine carboxypeptidase-like 33 isoform X2 n=1 Tax=Castanea sativa TaxID=21020 RepID=UPI003F65025C